jgi:hypothetical protein
MRNGILSCLYLPSSQQGYKPAAMSTWLLAKASEFRPQEPLAPQEPFEQNRNRHVLALLAEDNVADVADRAARGGDSEGQAPTRSISLR